MVIFKRIPHCSLRNTAAIAGVALLESVQVLIAVVWISSFVPVPAGPSIENLWPLHQKTLQPERELLFFQVFVVANVMLTAAGLWFWRRRREDPGLGKALVVFGAWEAVFILIELFAVFKMIVYGQPLWAQIVFYGAFAGSWSFKIFWPEFRQAVEGAGKWLSHPLPPWAAGAWDVGMAAVVVWALWIPDLDKAVSLAFVGGGFESLNHEAASPAWAAATGLKVGIDVHSPSGLGWGTFLAAGSGWLGGVDHRHLILFLAWLGMIYAAGTYVLLKELLLSRWLAGAGLLVMLKLQFLNAAMMPLPWVHPLMAGLPHLPDVFVLLCLYQHACRPTVVWLWVGGLCVGLAWLLSWYHGLVLFAVFLIYLLQQRKSVFGLWALLAGFLGAWMLVGPAILGKTFFRQSLGNAVTWWQDLNAAPEPYFGAAFWVPLIYASSFAAAWEMDRRHRNQREKAPWAFVALVSLYGLLSYGAFTGFYSHAAVLVLIVLFWGQQALAKAPAKMQSKVAAVFCLLSFGALLTNVVFMLYPNALNIGGVDWPNIKTVYATQAEVHSDAAMVERLTFPGQHVPILSGFDTQVLMAAGRRPFFYEARPNTNARSRRAAAQIQREHPPFIFVDKQWLNAEAALIKFIKDHYVPVEESQHLVALRKK